MHQKIEFHDWINIYTHILNRGDIIIHRRYNLIDSNESEIYCHDGWKQRSRLYSKIVGWNPPSPSIKMSERVSKSREMANFARKKKREKKREKKFSWEIRNPIYPELCRKFIIVGKRFCLRWEIYASYYAPPFFFFVALYQSRFISFYYCSKVVDE